MSKTHPEVSLSEVHGTVETNVKGGFWRRLLAFLGPAYLVSVGYMDPGNWATSLAGGSKFGYALLVVALIAVTGPFTRISPESTPAGPDTTPLTCAEVQVMEGMPGMEQMDHSTCTGTTTTGVPFDPTVGAGTGGAVTARDAFGDGLAVVTVSPATTGRNTVSVTLTDANGNAVDPEEPPTVQFRLRAKDVGPIAAEAERTGPGTYRLVVDFVLPGTWEVNVSAVLSDFEQPQAVVEIRVGS